MDQHLRCLAIPFAVLGVRWLVSLYFAGGDKICKSFGTPDYLSRRIFTERQMLSRQEYILKQYLFRG